MRIDVDNDAIRAYVTWDEHQVRHAIKEVADRVFRKTPEPHWKLPRTINKSEFKEKHTVDDKSRHSD